MGQFSHLKATIGPPPVVDQSYQQKVDKYRASLGYLNDPTQLSLNYKSLRAEKDALEEKVKDINIKLAAHENALVQWLETAGLTQMKNDNGDTFFIKDTPYTAVEDREKWMTYIHETRQEELLSVHYATMNAIVSDRLKNGQPVPPGLKVYIKSGITMRRGTR